MPEKIGDGPAGSIVELCGQFAALPIGTVVRFEGGVDFLTKPNSFRGQLHREMRNEGFVVQSVVRGPDVYAKIKRAIGPAEPAEAPATGSAEVDPGPVRSLVLGPTNPRVPAAVFQQPAGG